MAKVTGALSDFGLKPFPELQPRIIFTPSGPGIAGARLFATKPIIVTPAGSGSFTVDLTHTTSIRPVVWYTITIEWLDPSGNYISSDELAWKLFVPSTGGELSDLIDAPANPSLIWVGPTPPQKWGLGQMKWLYTGSDTANLKYGRLYISNDSAKDGA